MSPLFTKTNMCVCVCVWCVCVCVCVCDIMDLKFNHLPVVDSCLYERLYEVLLILAVVCQSEAWESGEDVGLLQRRAASVSGVWADVRRVSAGAAGLCRRGSCSLVAQQTLDRRRSRQRTAVPASEQAHPPRRQEVKPTQTPLQKQKSCDTNIFCKRKHF